MLQGMFLLGNTETSEKIYLPSCKDMKIQAARWNYPVLQTSFNIPQSFKDSK